MTTFLAYSIGALGFYFYHFWDCDCKEKNYIGFLLVYPALALEINIFTVTLYAIFNIIVMKTSKPRIFSLTKFIPKVLITIATIVLI